MFISKVFSRAQNLNSPFCRQFINNFSEAKPIVNVSIDRSVNFSSKKIVQLNIKHRNSKVHLNRFAFSTQKDNETEPSMIQSLQQVKRGNQFFAKNQFQSAQRQYLSAMQFLPTEGDQKYVSQYEKLLLRLIDASVKQGKSLKQLSKLELISQSQTIGFVKILSQLENAESQPKQLEQLANLQTSDKLWKKLVKIQALKASNKEYSELFDLQQISNCQDYALKYIGLSLYQQQKAKSKQNPEGDQIYVEACRDLLKQAEQKYRTSHKLLKPILLAARNMIAGDQRLQAEGLLSHCISTKEHLARLNINQLKIDQEYIFCKLKLAQVFNKLERNTEAQRIRDEYEPLFNANKYFIQQIVEIQRDHL